MDQLAWIHSYRIAVGGKVIGPGPVVGCSVDGGDLKHKGASFTDGIGGGCLKVKLELIVIAEIPIPATGSSSTMYNSHVKQVSRIG